VRSRVGALVCIYLCLKFCVWLFCAMLTKFQHITNLKKFLQVGILTFCRASVSSPFNRSPWVVLSGGIKGWAGMWKYREFKAKEKRGMHHKRSLRRVYRLLGAKIICSQTRGHHALLQHYPHLPSPRRVTAEVAASYFGHQLLSLNHFQKTRDSHKTNEILPLAVHFQCFCGCHGKGRGQKTCFASRLTPPPPPILEKKKWKYDLTF
jgi:hypothetical protein